MKHLVAACVLALSLQPALAQDEAPPADDLGALAPEAQMPVAESHVTTTLEPNPRRIYVLDSAFPAAQAAKAWILDGATGEIEGMFNMGYWPNMGMSPDGSEIYSLDSFWEKHTRGARHDYLTARDATTLEIRGEVLLPRGRFLVVPKKHNYEVTPEGGYGLSYNLAPATSVSVVDLREKAYRGEIEIPGCGLIFASAEDRFTTICSDGTLQTVTFSVAGDTIESEAGRTAPVFDPENDPVFEHAGFDRERKRLYLVSYSGMVHPIDLSGDLAQPEEPWPLAGDAERAEEWRPGGWQIAAFNPVTQRLYVLMHQGPEWTHKDPGVELWVADVAARSIERRIELADRTIAVAVSQEEEPLIYTLSEATDVIVYDAAGEEVATQEALGFSPQLIYVEGEY